VARRIGRADLRVSDYGHSSADARLQSCSRTSDRKPGIARKRVNQGPGTRIYPTDFYYPTPDMTIGASLFFWGSYHAETIISSRTLPRSGGGVSCHRCTLRLLTATARSQKYHSCKT
jgi:hypothetical protein